MDVLLSTAYWPNLHYFYFILNTDKVYLETHEHYQKQSFRNRTQLLSANGILDLSIPVKKSGNDALISGIEICYKERWQARHWRAITSAYNNSPYFEYFEDDLKTFYDREHRFLFDYNLQQLKTVLRILKIKKDILFTSSFEKKSTGISDQREAIHPKVNALAIKQTGPLLSRPYYQTFESKFGFTPNLSILDLLLNKGLETIDYFPKETLTL